MNATQCRGDTKVCTRVGMAGGWKCVYDKLMVTSNHVKLAIDSLNGGKSDNASTHFSDADSELFSLVQGGEFIGRGDLVYCQAWRVFTELIDFEVRDTDPGRMVADARAAFEKLGNARTINPQEMQELSETIRTALQSIHFRCQTLGKDINNCIIDNKCIRIWAERRVASAKTTKKIANGTKENARKRKQ